MFAFGHKCKTVWAYAHCSAKQESPFILPSLMSISEAHQKTPNYVI